VGLSDVEKDAEVVEVVEEEKGGEDKPVVPSWAVGGMHAGGGRGRWRHLEHRRRRLRPDDDDGSDEEEDDEEDDEEAEAEAEDGEDGAKAASSSSSSRSPLGVGREYPGFHLLGPDMYVLMLVPLIIPLIFRFMPASLTTLTHVLSPSHCRW
jgi:hypothetical protein